MAGLFLTGIVLLITTAAIGYAIISQGLPPVDAFDQNFSAYRNPTAIYDRSGQHLLLSLHVPELDSRMLAIEAPETEQFSADFLRLVIPARDPGFWEHSGSAGWAHLFDPQAITIAEELTEIAFGDRLGVGLSRAIRLRVLAREITDIYGRNQILTWYLNHAYFGQYAFGADAAARTYLNKSASELNIAESVLLCAILRAPALNPIDSQGAIRESYLAELALLRERGALSTEETAGLQTANFVVYEPLALESHISPNPILQKAILTAYQALGQETVERGGFVIRSTMDYDLQQALTCLTVAGGSEEDANCPQPDEFELSDSEYEDIKNAVTGAAFSAALIDVTNGQLLAAIDTEPKADGGQTLRNAFTPHDPGSSLTPFVALAALNRGYTLSSLAWDLETQGTSVPAGYANPDQKYHGPLRLRTALTEDYLRPISELLNEFGAGAVWTQAEKFGLTFTGMKNAADLIFSGGSVSADTLAAAYGVFANQGTLIKTGENYSAKNISLLSVETPEDEALFLQPANETALLDKGLAYLMVHLLGGETQAFGLSDRPAGIKIGRVFEKSDIWVTGFTPQITASVWLGGTSGNDNETTATKVWQILMTAAHTQEKAVAGWDIPENISHRMVCTPSGLLPGEACPQTVSEVFLKGSEPTSYDTLYANVPINRDNQLLATIYTPSGQIRKKTFMNLPEMAKSWAMENKIEWIPSEYDPVIPDDLENGPLKIISPQPFGIFSAHGDTDQVIEIIIDLQTTEPIQTYRVAYGSGLYPEHWTSGLEGEELPSGQLKIGTLDPAGFEPGLYVIRVSVTTESGRYTQAASVITVK